MYVKYAKEKQEEVIAALEFYYSGAVFVCVFISVGSVLQSETSPLPFQPGLTPYRAHAHKRYSSIVSCPRARFSDFFRATQNEM